jgi:8-oxo-dGTP diphosphatase
MVRRAAGVAKGGYWCFPGGHVERGETPRQAIQRELAEELGLEVVPTERVGSVRVLNARRYILAVWRVRLVGGELRPAQDEIAEARWLTPSEIRAIRPNLRSNFRVLEMLGV